MSELVHGSFETGVISGATIVLLLVSSDTYNFTYNYPHTCETDFGLMKEPCLGSRTISGG